MFRIPPTRSGSRSDQFYRRFVKSVRPLHSRVPDKQFRPALVGKDPDALQVSVLDKHLYEDGNVIRAGYGEVFERPADDFILRIPEQFAERRRDFNELAPSIEDGNVVGLNRRAMFGRKSGAEQVLGKEGTHRFRMSHENTANDPNLSPVLQRVNTLFLLLVEK